MSVAKFLLSLAVGLLCLAGQAACVIAEEPVFSGPQAGEPLPPLPVQRVLSEDPSAIVDVAVRESAAPHRLIVFVHQITRPSVGFTRVLGDYAATRAAEGLATSLVFLSDDATAVTEAVRRARHALPQRVTVGVSPDGAEGPGAYGLNRNVTLTIVLASQGTVTANHTLIDPSLPVDLPKVLQSICDLLGSEPPSVESLTTNARGGDDGSGSPSMRTAAADPVPEGFQAIEPLLRRLIQQTASDAEVDRLAAAISEKLQGSPAAREHLRGISGRVHRIYGTPRAQHHLRHWAGVAESASPPANDTTEASAD